MTAGSVPVTPHQTDSSFAAQPSSARVAAALWARYRANSDEDARQELLHQHLPLVHFVARPVAAKTPMLEYGELISAGTLGLMAAIDGYDPRRGFAFTTYAVRRIRGAMLDELRSRDWMPRSSRTKSRRLSAARDQLRAVLQREPAPAEVASRLGLTLETYWRWCDQLDLRPPGSGAAAEERGDAATQNEAVALATPDEDAPDRILLAQEERARLRAAIERLPERLQQVLALCYYEELSLKEVGAVLGVSESRVSQLRQQALAMVSGLIGEHGQVEPEAWSRFG